jgi:hypothetical protein
VSGRFRLALLVALVFSPVTTTAQADYCSPYRWNAVCNDNLVLTTYNNNPVYWVFPGTGCRGLTCIRHGKCVSDFNQDDCAGSKGQVQSSWLPSMDLHNHSLDRRVQPVGKAVNAREKPCPPLSPWQRYDSRDLHRA